MVLFCLKSTGYKIAASRFWVKTRKIVTYLFLNGNYLLFQPDTTDSGANVRASKNMNIPFFVRIRSIFTKDKAVFWWSYFTDEEKELQRMDVWELAALIEEENVSSSIKKKRIVAEHMLNVRLAQIQSKASWGSGVLSFVGAIFGVTLSIFFANTFQTPSQVSCTTKQSIATPVKDLQK